MGKVGTEATLQDIRDLTSFIAGEMGVDSSGLITDWGKFVRLVRAGVISRYAKVGELFKANRESGLSVTVFGSITSATVNEETFLAHEQYVGTTTFEFTYDGAAWHHEGEAVSLSEWGITVVGTPSAGDIVAVHETASVIYLDLLDHDYDVAVDSAKEHVTTFGTRDIISYGTIPFSAPQALKAIAADEFPDGIAAGSDVSITLDHGCYDGTTKQDGTYHFTATADIPVGYKIRHTQIGAWQSSAADYTAAKILSGEFRIYDENGAQVASYPTVEGASGINLGTCTAETKSYMVGSHLNSTRRNAYGSNRSLHSAQRKWLRSNAAGAASGAVASWWEASDEFDMPVRTTLPGFRHGLDPLLDAAICPVRKRTLLHPWDRVGSETYEDTEETIFQFSMTELGFGNNSGVAECSVNADGTLHKTGPYAFYDGAANEDRVKTENGTARYWFHRSPNPSHAISVRGCTPAGSLYISGADDAHGVVAGLPIG